MSQTYGCRWQTENLSKKWLAAINKFGRCVQRQNKSIEDRRLRPRTKFKDAHAHE